MSSPSLTHRLEYSLLVVLAGILIRLPEPVSAALGSGLGWAAGAVLRLRRRVVEENLERAFPDRSRRWRQSVALRTYRHFGRELVSILRFRRMSPEEIRERCEVEDFHLIREPTSRGEGVLVLIAHFGNWELAAASPVAWGVPVDAVVRRQRNSLFDSYVARTRGQLGIGVIYQDDALRSGIQRLRAGKALALAADQNFAGNGVFVDFFGFSASTARGPGVLALRTGARIVFVDPRRQPGSRARYKVRFAELPIPATGDLQKDVRQLTRSYMEKLEEVIRESPEQYFWLHRRWKTRPSGREPDVEPEVAGRAHDSGSPRGASR